MTISIPDLSKTLEQIEKQHWPEPEWQSHLVVECHRLRRVPLREFTPGNLRIMVGQSIGLESLAPLALQILADDPLLEAELYPGDLLFALLHSDSTFWAAHPDWRATLSSIAKSARFRLDALAKSERDSGEESLYDAISRFQRSA
jgi:hypothetical protein